ncbi:MAG: 3'(2'),5'-bisphosphate nucleotidase CysQ [Bdellovibrionales bacterium]|nr:3'(2'),5'-bisphosphate nucleotidase CysQ [Bdellovibrionales bacterium]
MIDYRCVLPRIVSIAVEAGNEILKFYQDPIKVEAKQDDSPLTQADLASHRAIEAGLRKFSVGATPLPVLSEESAQEAFERRSAWSAFWLVDPLDGTKEFISKNGEFTVNIALVEGSLPTAGVVYVPAQSVAYFGAEGIGSFRLTVPDAQCGFEVETFADLSSAAVRLTGEPANGRAYTVIGSRSHGSPEFEDFVAAIKQEHPDMEVLSAGSSLKFCRVAEGAADLYPRLGRTMEWDTAAGHAVVRGVGKKVVAYDSSEELQYNKADLANPWFIAGR